MKSPTPAPAKTTKPDAIDSELVRKLAQLLNETDLAELEVEKGDLRIRVARCTANPALRSPCSTATDSAGSVHASSRPGSPCRRRGEL